MLQTATDGGMQLKEPPFDCTAPRRRWTYGSTTNTNVFLHNDYFYIALSSLVLLSKQKNIVFYENKKNRNHIKNTIAIVSIFHGCYSDALKKSWKKRVNKATEAKLQWGREEANKFDERQGLSLSATRRLILSRDVSHLPLPDLSNAQLTHFIIILIRILSPSTSSIQNSNIIWMFHAEKKKHAAQRVICILFLLQWKKKLGIHSVS